MTKIYSNIPVPSKAFRNRKTTIADELEIGQSIFSVRRKKKAHWSRCKQSTSAPSTSRSVRESPIQAK